MSKIFVDFRLKNDPLLFSEKVVIGILENCNINARHAITDFHRVKKSEHIVCILPFETEERVKEKIISCFDDNILSSSKTISFVNGETAIALYPELLISVSETEDIFINPLPLNFFSKNTISCILPNLFISDMFCAQDEDIVSKLDITAVINLSPDLAKNAFESNPNFIYLTLHIQDNAKTDISKYFDVTKNFIDKHKKSRKILVHCAAGISRSATIIIAYVMKTLHLSFQDAFTFVQEKHSATDPNLNFLIQLMQYEK